MRYVGGGCRTCPVENCETWTYRGRICASQRWRYGITNDPQTKAEKLGIEIKYMTDEELYKFLKEYIKSFERMKKCENCGQLKDVNSLYCSNCGIKMT